MCLLQIQCLCSLIKCILFNSSSGNDSLSCFVQIYSLRTVRKDKLNIKYMFEASIQREIERLRSVIGRNPREVSLAFDTAFSLQETDNF